MKRFKLSTEVLFSEDAIDALLEEKDENAVLITDKFMVDSGMADIILKKLSNCNSVSVFDEVIPDPPMDLIERGIDFLQDKDCDVVVALGGGSSIDAAKAIVFMARKIELAQNPESTKKIKLIALPTTSGTGSEVTQFAVVTDSKTGVKIPLIDESLMPDIAILDPELVKSAPPFITADTGMDVITHAIEAYVSVMASDYTDGLALHAIEMVFTYLEKSYAGDKLAREKMHNASCIAGMAFTNAFLGLNHSMAHKLGAECHIPHGRANAILLPYVIKYNATKPTKFASFPKYKEYVADERYAKIARRVGLCSADTPISEAVDCLVKAIRELMTVTERPLCIKDCGVSEAEFMSKVDELSYKAFEDQCTTANPVYPLVSEIKELYREAYYGE